MKRVVCEVCSAVLFVTSQITSKLLIHQRSVSALRPGRTETKSSRASNWKCAEIIRSLTWICVDQKLLSLKHNSLRTQLQISVLITLTDSGTFDSVRQCWTHKKSTFSVANTRFYCIQISRRLGWDVWRDTGRENFEYTALKILFLDLEFLTLKTPLRPARREEPTRIIRPLHWTAWLRCPG